MTDGCIDCSPSFIHKMCQPLAGLGGIRYSGSPHQLTVTYRLTEGEELPLVRYLLTPTV